MLFTNLRIDSGRPQEKPIKAVGEKSSHRNNGNATMALAIPEEEKEWGCRKSFGVAVFVGLKIVFKEYSPLKFSTLRTIILEYLCLISGAFFNDIIIYPRFKII